MQYLICGEILTMLEHDNYSNNIFISTNKRDPEKEASRFVGNTSSISGLNIIYFPPPIELLLQLCMWNIYFSQLVAYREFLLTMSCYW